MLTCLEMLLCILHSFHETVLPTACDITHIHLTARAARRLSVSELEVDIAAAAASAIPATASPLGRLPSLRLLRNARFSCRQQRRKAERRKHRRIIRSCTAFPRSAAAGDSITTRLQLLLLLPLLSLLGFWLMLPGMLRLVCRICFYGCGKKVLRLHCSGECCWGGWLR